MFPLSRLLRARQHSSNSFAIPWFATATRRFPTSRHQNDGVDKPSPAQITLEVFADKARHVSNITSKLDAFTSSSRSLRSRKKDLYIPFNGIAA